MYFIQITAKISIIGNLYFDICDKSNILIVVMLNITFVREMLEVTWDHVKATRAAP